MKKILGSLIETPPGKLRLVPESDKRPELKLSAEIDLRRNKLCQIKLLQVKLDFICECVRAKSINGSDPKYSVSLIIPKEDKVTIDKIKAAIEVAKKEGLSKLGGKIPANLKHL